eukprot:1140551-Pelagomonas_calceolata.AAC.4
MVTTLQNPPSMATAISNSDCLMAHNGSSHMCIHAQSGSREKQSTLTMAQYPPSMATAVSTSDCVVAHSGSSDTAAAAKGGSCSLDSLNSRVLRTSWNTYDCKVLIVKCALCVCVCVCARASPCPSAA